MGNNLALPWIASCIQRPARPRKLRLGHFAFMRVLVQGLDTRVAWNRYLRLKGDHGDARTVRKMIAWLRDEFATAARRCQRHGAARLVLVDLAAVMAATPALPAIADFVAERGHEVLPRPNNWPPMKPSTATARRARLIGRQLETLRWLESLIAEPPHADDVGSWLHPDLAARLERAGLLTVSALIDRINGLRSVWYRDLLWRGVEYRTTISPCQHGQVGGPCSGYDIAGIAPALR